MATQELTVMASLDEMTSDALHAQSVRGRALAGAKVMLAGGPDGVNYALDQLDAMYTDVPDNTRGAKVLQAWALIDRARVLVADWMAALGTDDESVIVTDLQSTLVHLAARAPRGVAKGDDAERARARLASIVKVLAAVKQTPVAMTATRDGASDAWARVNAAMAARNAPKTPKTPKQLPGNVEAVTQPNGKTTVRAAK